MDINSLTNQQIIDIYTNVGPTHNEGLGYVLNSLKSTYGSVYKGGNSAAAYNTMSQNIRIYIKNFLVAKHSVTQSIADTISSAFNSTYGKDFGTNLNTALTYSPYYSSMSSAFKTAISQLNNVVQDSTKAYAKANNDAIYNNNISLLSSNWEKMNLVSMCSTGYSSRTYWRDSGYKWAQFFSNTTAIIADNHTTAQTKYNTDNKNIISNKDNTSSLKRSTEVAIGNADIEGIVGGAVVGCYTTATVATVLLPGAGTITGCAGGAAVGAIIGGLGGSGVAALHAFVSWPSPD